MQNKESSVNTVDILEIMEKIQVINDILIDNIEDENQTLLCIVSDYIVQGQDKLLSLQEQMKKAFE